MLRCLRIRALDAFDFGIFCDTKANEKIVFEADEEKRSAGIALAASAAAKLMIYSGIKTYEPYFEYAINLHFFIRTAMSPAVHVKPITDVLGGLDSTSAIETKPMSQALGLALLPSQAGAAMLGAMGILGLLLASIGLYGVLSYSVSRRRREIGVRVAVGATRVDVLRLIGRQSLTLVGSGMLAGLALAVVAVQPVTLLLVPDVRPLDSAAFVAVIGVLTIVALFATLGPATRALRVDPMTALRYE